ncbi:MAG: DUF485 domain-containing protein [Actinomycetota bacterium]|nr:DUF485 domain-containing protein [Actinomycetota bacterium]
MTDGRLTESEADRGDLPTSASYTAMEQSEEFIALRRAFRRFVFPMTAVFLGWYLLYVLLSAYARDFMSTKVVGNINIALIFGLAQFATTFLIAWWYARYAGKKLDPLADRMRETMERTQR